MGLNTTMRALKEPQVVMSVMTGYSPDGIPTGGPRGVRIGFFFYF